MSKFAREIRHKIPQDAFTERDLKLLMRKATPASRYNKVKRALASGDLLSLKRGVYAFSNDIRKDGLHLFEISHLLYDMSYISLESALSYYGLIPERVSTVTSVTTKAVARFKTPLAFFTYEHLPKEMFRHGFRRVKEGNHTFLISTPLKAVLDTIFLRKKSFSDLDNLAKDLRLDMQQLKEKISDMSNTELAHYREVYRNKTIDKFLEQVVWKLR